MDNALTFPTDPWVAELVRRSLAEDIGPGDATTTVAVDPSSRARALVVPRRAGVCAGLPLLAMVYGELSDAVHCELLARDGQRVETGRPLAAVTGPAGAILTGERTALNFLQHLGGIATRTAELVDAVSGTDCRILDTRKTLPGYRRLAKYAVRCGGGQNHRMGLYDRIMLKDNHWAARREPLADIVARARREFPALEIEVEVDDLDQLTAVLPLDVEWILLDNFSVEMTRDAVARRDRAGVSSRLESSGNLGLETVTAYARAGVDAISVGSLTHSVTAWDVGLDFAPESGSMP